MSANGKSQLNPRVQIDLLHNLGRELPVVVKKLEKIRMQEWEVLKKEYFFYHRIHPGDKEAQYRQSGHDIWCRLEAFPGGQVVAAFEDPEEGLRPIGMISSIRRNNIFGEYNQVTDKGTYGSHESDGKIFGCCEITVNRREPDDIKAHVAKALINKEIEICEGMRVPIAVAKTRPYGIISHMRNDGLTNYQIKRILKERKDMEPFMEYMREYIKPVGGGKRMKNPVLGMHYSNGAEIEEWGIEYGTRCFDRESGGSTIIAVYKGKDALKQMRL